MSVQQKKVITIAVAVVLMAVFAFVFYFDNNKPPSAQKKEVATNNTETSDMEPRREPETDSEIESARESEITSDQTKRLSEDEVTESQKIAVEFVKHYAAFDASHPTRNIENAKPFMSNDMYQDYIKNPERGTLTRVKVIPESFDLTNVSNDDPELIQWNVIMRGKVLDNEGNEKPEEDWYLVTMQNISGELKVVGVRVNLPN